MFIIMIRYEKIKDSKSLILLLLTSIMFVFIFYFLILEYTKYIYTNVLICSLESNIIMATPDDFNEPVTAVYNRSNRNNKQRVWNAVNLGYDYYLHNRTNKCITDNMADADIQDTIHKLMDPNAVNTMTIRNFVVIKYVSNRYSSDAKSWLSGLGNLEPVNMKNQSGYSWLHTPWKREAMVQELLNVADSRPR